LAPDVGWSLEQVPVGATPPDPLHDFVEDAGFVPCHLRLSSFCGELPGTQPHPVLLGEDFVDAIGGTSPEAHRAGLDRVIQAGGQPISWVSLAVELQRDWARQETVQAIIEIVLTDRLRKEEAPTG
jgi:hypothetical protein